MIYLGMSRILDLDMVVLAILLKHSDESIIQVYLFIQLTN